jgi:hypothetical protein
MEHRWIMGGPQVEFTYMWIIFGTWVEHRKWSSFLQVHIILESLFVRGIFINYYKSMWDVTVVFISMVLTTNNKNNSRKLMVFFNSISKILI